MQPYIAFDSHKHYTLAGVESKDGRTVRETKIAHERGAIREFLAGIEPGTPVAVEAMGSWYWIVDEIEEAGCLPRLVHPRKARLMMGMINKSDKLDVRGMNRLQRNGTLPAVWIPPKELRDVRDLLRTRLVFVRQRTGLKNRFHATLAKYALKVDASDIFAPGCRAELERQMEFLPEQTYFCAREELDWIDHFGEEIAWFVGRIGQVFETTAEVELLDTLPGVGFILAVTIWLEVGSVGRFPSHEKLAAYSGTVPRLHQSGGRRRDGRTRPDVNRFLKWAYVEAANASVIHRKKRPHRHVSRLYERIRARRGHPKAAVAVARHLAEATWWMLTRKERYREPSRKPVSSTQARARLLHERTTLGD